MVEEIERQIILEEIGTNWNALIMRIPCLAHIVQLVVKAFLDGIKATAENDIIIKVVGDKDLEAVQKLKQGTFKATMAKVIITHVVTVVTGNGANQLEIQFPTL